jgi:hypothetical protein
VNTIAGISADAGIRLYDLAHARAGDKGDRLNLALFAYRPEDYPLLVEQVTGERVAALFRHRGVSRVVRYLVPSLHAINFVLDDVLEGGVNGALNLDGHGKSLSYLLLAAPLHAPDER